jgi:hypothetical protein
MDSKTDWGNKEHPPFVTVYKPMAGWKAVLYVWCVDLACGYADYEPWQTGICGYRTRDEAIAEGMRWAEDEEIEFKQ